MNGAIEVERRGRVALMFLNRPAVGNALDDDIKTGLRQTLTELQADPTVGALVISGRGKMFSAGGDLGTLQTCSAADMAGRIREAHEWAYLLANYRKPVVAAVNGPAVGAGLGLALLSDFVLISEEAFVMAGFLAIGAVPDIGVAYMLPRYVGLQRAKEMVATNRRVDATEAVALGLALRAHSGATLLDEAILFAEKISDLAPLAFAQTKVLLNQAFDTSLTAFFEKEASFQTIVFGGDEIKEGIAAFRDKRRPRFVA